MKPKTEEAAKPVEAPKKPEEAKPKADAPKKPEAEAPKKEEAPKKPAEKAPEENKSDLEVESEKLESIAAEGDKIFTAGDGLF